MNTYLNASYLPVLTGGEVNLTCKDSYAINGEIGVINQLIKCIGNAIWDFSTVKPCEGITVKTYFVYMYY